MLAGRLKPGMIGVNLKGDLDAMGTINVLLQGDTQAAHVWWVLPSRKIATTGAEHWAVYGERDPEEYLKNKKFFLIQTVDPLPPDKLEILQKCHDEIMASGVKRIYGGWKFALMWLIAATGSGFISKTGKKVKTTVPEFPICSQAVAYCFWSAGIPIGKANGKEDWTGVLPETILAEAQEGTDRLLYLTAGSHPCYFLNLVEQLPFSGIAT